VTGPAASVSAFSIFLGDLGDTLNLNGIENAITADGQTGTDTIAVGVTMDTSGGGVALTAETLNVNAPIFAGATTFSADTLNIGDADFMAGNYQFSGAGAGAVLNQGAITAADGGRFKAYMTVPASGRAVVLSSGRTQSREAPSPDATKTICRPSGESAKEMRSEVAGVLISTRVSGRWGERKYITAGIANRTAAEKAMMAANPAALTRRFAAPSPRGRGT